MTRTWVVTERKVSSSKIMAIWGDRFEDGVLARRDDYYGDAYAEPDGKVYNWCVNDWWGKYLIYVRQSFYDSLGQDERDWLIGKGVRVVSADWYPGFICKEGEKRTPKTCWDGTTIHGEVCRNNAWIPSGETCPPKPECTEGDKKAGYICVAGKWQTAPAVPEPVVPPVEPPVEPPACEEGKVVCEYHAGQGRYLLKKCVDGKMVFERWCGADDTCESGVCISKPECTEGDKKPGHICEGGRWVPYTPPVIPVVPPVEPAAAPPKYLTPAEADERIRAGLPCYIKCVLPILDLLPGIPYTRGAWVPPFCEITTEP